MHAAGPRSIQKLFFLPRLQMGLSVYMSHAGFQHPLPLPARVTVDRCHPSSALEAGPPLPVGLVACGLTVSHNIIFQAPPYIWPACKCSQPVTIATNSRPLKQSPTAHHQSQPHSPATLAQPPWPSHPPASHRASQPEIWDRTMGGGGGGPAPLNPDKNIYVRAALIYMYVIDFTP